MRLGWILPKGVRREIEYRLRNRGKLRAEAERLLAEALSDAVSLSGPLAREGGSGSGLPGDPTGRAAEKVIRARERIERAEKWERVFDAAGRQYPPGSDHHKIITLHYEGGIGFGALAEMMHYERQSVMRKRDEYLTLCAFIAAEEGLTRKE